MWQLCLKIRTIEEKCLRIQFAWTEYGGILTIGRFDTVICDGPFGFFIACFWFGLATVAFGRCGFVRSIVAFTITVINIAYSNCYWITFGWHSIALYAKMRKTRGKNTHIRINYRTRDLQSNLCIFFCWLNCNNWLKLIQIAQKWMHRESREGKRKAPVFVTRLHWNDRKFYWFIHCNNVNTINCLRLMRVYQNSKSQKTRISSVVE